MMNQTICVFYTNIMPVDQVFQQSVALIQMNSKEKTCAFSSISN